MKKALLLLLIGAVFPAIGFGQMFNPPASALPDGVINEPYTGQIINFTVPETTTVSGELVEQAIGLLYPQAAPVIGLLGIGGQNFDFNVDNTTLLVNGLPSGLGASCDANPCTYIANASGYITIAGTPGQSGNFTINITNLTEGEADISSIGGGILSQFGIPTSFALPTPVPTALNEEDYTLSVSNPNGISETNESFALKVFPNPTSNSTTLSINSIEAGKGIVEIYDPTGKLARSFAITTSVGQNRISINLEELNKGLYFLKVTLNGSPALIRLEKS